MLQTADKIDCFSLPSDESGDGNTTYFDVPQPAKPLRVLHLEDDDQDAELVQTTLIHSGGSYVFTRVQSREEFQAAITNQEFDLILSDYGLGDFDGLTALRHIRKISADIPFILVSGTIGEEQAIESLKSGATDYILKTRLARLPAAIDRALKEMAERISRRKAETERQMMEIQLRQAQKLESIGRLAAGVAHEINTPTQYIGDNIMFIRDSLGELMSPLRLFGQLVQAARDNKLDPELLDSAEAAIKTADLDYLMEEMPKAVEQSLQGVDRVTKIVRAMKEFSHPGAAEKTKVDLNHCIDSTLTVARNEWKYVANLVTDFDPNLPPVTCLPGEFNQVILNLIINAAHAIGDTLNPQTSEKGTITVRTRQDGDWVEVRIGDTGSGIPEAARAKIFEPFFTTKSVGKGTGQGLAIARSVIVDKHGGTIRFETELGKGTTFLIRIPISSKGERQMPVQESNQHIQGNSHS